MFLYLNREDIQPVYVTASEGRGTLPVALFEFEHLTTGDIFVLELENMSTHPERYDHFEINGTELEDLPPGDLIYRITAKPGNGSIDPDIILETGRARIRETFTETVTVYNKASEDVVYERS